MKKLSQKGFTHLELALIAVVVLLIGGVGFYVFKQTQNKASPDENTVTQSKPAAETSPQPEPSAQKYLTIPEFGVKMPLSETIADAYYYIDPAYNSPDRPAYAYLSLKSLKDVDICAAEKTSLGILSKNPANFVSPMTGETYSEIAKQQPSKTLGDYVYIYTQPQASCYHNPTPETNAKQQEIIQAFKAAAKQLEAL